MKPDLKKLLIDSERTLDEVMLLMGEIQERILLVADEDLKLLGTVTDGDIRRAVIERIDPQSKISIVMQKKPITAKVGTPKKDLLEIMVEKDILAIPIVNKAGKIQDIQTILFLTKTKKIENTVLIMAGGYGRRLGKLTKRKPKPLLKVQDVPLLEKIIQNLSSEGFKNIIISTHYKSQMITKYFGNGKKWKVNIEYIVEEQPLGTAGCLKLLSKSKIKDLPFIITNSDLVTEIEFKKILNYHSESKSKATICLSQYDMMIPFGVAKLKKNLLEKIVEKPVEKFFVNAGIYVLEPSVLDNLENFDEKFDMTRVLDHIVSNGDNVHAFPIYEYWMDVGQLSEFKLVSQKYKGE